MFKAPQKDLVKGGGFKAPAKDLQLQEPSQEVPGIMTTDYWKGLVGNIPPNLKEMGEASPAGVGRAEFQKTGSLMKGVGATAKEVVRPFLNPHTQTIPASVQANIPAQEEAVGMVRFGKQLIGHPIKTAYEKPVSTAMTAAMAAPVLGEMANKIIPFTREAKIARAPKLAESAVSELRTYLNPKQGVINKIEVRAHGNVDDILKIGADLAQKGELPLKSTLGEKGTRKLDTTQTLPIIRKKLSAIDSIIETKTKLDNITTNLNDIKKEAKQKIDASYDNAEEARAAKAEVDKFIDAEISRHGKRVSLIKGGKARPSAPTGNISTGDLNRVKKGMWSVGYNQMNPTSHEVSRLLGNIIKEKLQTILPDQTIDFEGKQYSLKDLNSLSGKYNTLKYILEKANGNILPEGKIGRYFRQAIGAGVGAAAGTAIPIPGVGSAVGAMMGSKAGGLYSDFATSPSRAIANIAKKMTKAERYRNLLERNK